MRESADRLAGLGQKSKHRRQVLHAFSDDMDDALLALQLAGHSDKTGAEHDRAQTFENLRPYNDVGDSGLILQRHEDDAARGTRSLTHEHEAGDHDALSILDLAQRL